MWSWVRSKGFSLCHKIEFSTGVEPTSFLSRLYKALVLPQLDWQSMNLTTCLHVLPRLRMRGVLYLESVLFEGKITLILSSVLLHMRVEIFTVVKIESSCLSYG